MHLLGDVGPRWMILKAALFFVGGLLSVVTLLLEAPSLQNALLLSCSIWCFCRFYYFCFHVMERYLGVRRVSGLLAALRAPPVR